MYTEQFVNTKIYFAIYVLLTFIVCSCEQDVTIEINTSDKRLIVVGEFTTDSVIHCAHLYCSGNLLTGKPQTVVSGANMFITDKTDTFKYVESKTNPGLYQTLEKCRGIGGRVYNLSISGFNIDNDGHMDSYVANSMMPGAIVFDSLASNYGLDGDNKFAVINLAYYKIVDNGSDYVYNFMQINNKEIKTIFDRLGSGEFSAAENEYRVSHVNNIPYNRPRYFSLDKASVNVGDTLTFVGYNFTAKQYAFLIAFDNNTNGDLFIDNFMDQLNVPSNLPTNIEPKDKAAGYFFVYSISRISKVF